MKCLFPKFYDPVARKLSLAGFQIPCGKCYYCLKDRAKSWSLRFSHEQRVSKSVFFSTLTYDDDHLPAGGCLNYRDVQLFHMRLRKRFGSFRFFLCGEYGPQTGRAHYHSAYFFKHSVVDFECDSDWNLGFTSSRIVNEQDAAGMYVAQYVLKKWKTEEQFGYAVPPFLRCSQGIGKDFILPRALQVMERGYLYIGKYKAPIPRYYLKLFEREFPAEFKEFSRRRVSSRVFGLDDISNEESYIQEHKDDALSYHDKRKKDFLSGATRFS